MLNMEKSGLENIVTFSATRDETTAIQMNTYTHTGTNRKWLVTEMDAFLFCGGERPNAIELGDLHGKNRS